MILAAENVAYSYDGEGVIEGVSLEVDPGEVLAIVGPSGTGKTTLLRVLALFDPPEEGTVLADGEDVWARSEERRLPIRRRIGMVFQDRSLFSTSAARNAAYGLFVRRSWDERLRSSLAAFLGRDGSPDGAYDALETVGLAEKADQHAGSLSAGEAQRVAFARALATEPDILLLDEFTSNLDPRNTAVLETAIDRARDRGIGVAMATHDMQQARRIADRTAVLLDGTCIECGRTERVFENPRDERARKFIAGELVY
ncbi:phosphate ABC transporter ATP-binding protein [Halobacteriales archaeon QS_3_64_16]|nr:MAG: phosphate ABC transporter ATP-binding protein [Halobacteriales archaeon QS_3_64_16]